MKFVIIACVVVAFFIGLLALLTACATHAPDEDMNPADAHAITDWLKDHP